MGFSTREPAPAPVPMLTTLRPARVPALLEAPTACPVSGRTRDAFAAAPEPAAADTTRTRPSVEGSLVRGSDKGATNLRPVAAPAAAAAAPEAASAEPSAFPLAPAAELLPPCRTFWWTNTPAAATSSLLVSPRKARSAGSMLPLPLPLPPLPLPLPLPALGSATRQGTTRASCARRNQPKKGQKPGGGGAAGRFPFPVPFPAPGRAPYRLSMAAASGRARSLSAPAPVPEPGMP